MDVVPQIQELSSEAVNFYDLAHHFHHKPYFVLLDNQRGDQQAPAFSYIAFEPFLIFTSKSDRRTIRRIHKGGQESIEKSGTTDDPFAELDEILDRYHIPDDNGIAPFLGGGIGYFGYELGRQMETLPNTTKDVMNIPECYFCFYNAVIIYNHQQEKIYLSYFSPGFAAPIASARQMIEEISRVSGLTNKPESGPDIAPVDVTETFRGDFSAGQYMDAVNRIKSYILAGDVYQVDLTQRFEKDVSGIDPWDIYKCLMRINPSPYASYLNLTTDPGLGNHCKGVTVVSSSPESFLTLRNRHVETRPIKGTVKRGITAQQDEEQKRFLLSDEKNGAELAMIVDLLRNDIGRVCRTGTVKVDAFPQLETYSSVHHLAATISGQLNEGITIMDLLKATFPGGSVTGVPKIRAMEILDELEPVERGVYTGSIGYLGFNGCSALNIVIRTIVMVDGKAHIQAGGGIVADSNDRDEYDESLLKAQKLFNAILLATQAHLK